MGTLESDRKRLDPLVVLVLPWWSLLLFVLFCASFELGELDAEPLYIHSFWFPSGLPWLEQGFQPFLLLYSMHVAGRKSSSQILKVWDGVRGSGGNAWELILVGWRWRLCETSHSPVLRSSFVRHILDVLMGPLSQSTCSTGGFQIPWVPPPQGWPWWMVWRWYHVSPLWGGLDETWVLSIVVYLALTLTLVKWGYIVRAWGEWTPIWANNFIDASFPYSTSWWLWTGGLDTNQAHAILLLVNCFHEWVVHYICSTLRVGVLP